VTLYKDIQRASKVAEGSTSDTLPADVTLTEQNSSGLSGSVSLYSFDDDDTEIVLAVPFYYVEVFSDSARLAGSLVAQAISFGGTASGLTLSEVEDSGLSGSVDLDFKKEVHDIEVEVPMHFVRLYRQDPSGLTEEEKAAELVALGGSASASASGLELREVAGSGATGSVDLSYSADATGIVLQVGWQAGDKWTFKTTSDEAGTFQCFFRDQLAITLPSVTDGSETINDSLAE
jgi:hypothetical protein